MSQVYYLNIKVYKLSSFLFSLYKIHSQWKAELGNYEINFIQPLLYDQTVLTRSQWML